SGIEAFNVSNGTYDLGLDMAAAGFQDGKTAADQVMASLDSTGTLFNLLAGKDGATPTPFFSAPRNQINSFTLLGSSAPTKFDIEETAGGVPSFAGSAPTLFNGKPTGAHSDARLLPAGTLPPANASINFHGGNPTDQLKLGLTRAHTVTYVSDSALTSSSN